MEFTQYITNEALDEALTTWVSEYPHLLRREELGRSHGGLPIWLLTLTNAATGGDLEKPAVWLDANIHATELAGTTTLLYFLQHALAQYGQEARVTRLLDTCVFYVVPRINPDGAAAALDASPRFLRSGVRPYPWQELDEGLHVQDIDGDSRILQMRIPDPNGDWKPWEQDARLLVKRQPEETGGTYYRLLPEGLMENYDGYLIKLARPAAGLDFNRNFPFEWRPENEQSGAGPFPASEPEIGCVVRFIAEHRNINVALTFHTFSQVLLRPYSTRPDDQMDPNDLRIYKQLGEIGTRLTGYRSISTFHDFLYNPKEVTTGAFDDWLYDHFGAYVFTVELWDLPSEAGIQHRKLIEWFSNHPVEDDARILQWADANIGPEGYLPWQPFEHPQLGPVELGGWNALCTWRNPPPALLEREAARHLPYILTLAELMPHLQVHTLTAKPVGENLWAIDLVIENSGYLPSYTSQQARARQAVREVSVEIKLPAGSRLELGKPRTMLGHLEGRSNKDDMAAIFGASPTDNRAHVQWLVAGQQGWQVEFVIRSERAGTLHRALELVQGGSNGLPAQRGYEGSPTT